MIKEDAKAFAGCGILLVLGTIVIMATVVAIALLVRLFLWVVQ